MRIGTMALLLTMATAREVEAGRARLRVERAQGIARREALGHVGEAVDLATHLQCIRNVYAVHVVA